MLAIIIDLLVNKTSEELPPEGVQIPNYNGKRNTSTKLQYLVIRKKKKKNCQTIAQNLYLLPPEYKLKNKKA